MSEADDLTAELTASYWRAYDQRLAETGFGAIARQLPGLIGQAIRLGWEANRSDPWSGGPPATWPHRAVGGARGTARRAGRDVELCQSCCP